MVLQPSPRLVASTAAGSVGAMRACSGVVAHAPTEKPITVQQPTRSCCRERRSPRPTPPRSGNSECPSDGRSGIA